MLSPPLRLKKEAEWQVEEKAREVVPQYNKMSHVDSVMYSINI